MTLNHWGYWVILVAALLEASPLFGILVPGQTLVILGGFFVKTGVLEIGDVFFVAATGAILGDFLGYELGRRYGYGFLYRFGKYFFFKKEYLERTKALVERHVDKTLVIGRFNSLTRAFAPFVVGSMKVPFFRFLKFNLIGGLSWAAVFVGIGYIFGQSYELASRYFGDLVLLFIALTIGGFYLVKFLTRIKK